MSNRPTARKPSVRGSRVARSAGDSGQGGSVQTAPLSRSSRSNRSARGSKHNAESGVLDAAPRELSLPARRRGCFAAVVSVVILGLLAAGIGWLVWSAWMRYDDATDIQGVWKDVSNDTQVAIDASRMLLGQQVIYDYDIDTKNKTITYRFNDFQGLATYRFSEDRQILVIEENGHTDWLVVLHLKPDPLIEGSEIPQGCTRLERQQGYAQDHFSAYDRNQGGIQSSTQVNVSSSVGRLPAYNSETGRFYDAATGYVYDEASGLFLDEVEGWSFSPEELGYDAAALTKGLVGGQASATSTAEADGEDAETGSTDEASVSGVYATDAGASEDMSWDTSDNGLYAEEALDDGQGSW